MPSSPATSPRVQAVQRAVDVAPPDKNRLALQTEIVARRDRAKAAVPKAK